MVKSLVDYFRLANRLFSPAASVARPRPSYLVVRSSGVCALRARLQWLLRPKLCPLQTTRSWARRGMLWLASREQWPVPTEQQMHSLLVDNLMFALRCAASRSSPLRTTARPQSESPVSFAGAPRI